MDQHFLSNLPRTKTAKTKRLGRGYGSGVGSHTVGRGQKGQKARTSMPILFDGTKNKKSLVQRLPILRGKNKFKSLKTKPVILGLNDLNKFPQGSLIDLASLLEKKVISSTDIRKGVKILGTGKINHKLTVSLPTSGSAKKAIESAGGAVLDQQ